jgi:hypothetical protein
MRFFVMRLKVVGVEVERSLVAGRSFFLLLGVEKVGWRDMVVKGLELTKSSRGSVMVQNLLLVMKL